jgi:hypothetical protein
MGVKGMPLLFGPMKTPTTLENDFRSTGKESHTFVTTDPNRVERERAMTTYRVASLTAVCVICLVGTVWCGTTGGGGKNVRFASERSPYPFVGATRVVLDGFDPKDKDAKSAMLQLDKNEVTFSSFGDPRITAVFYKPFQVKLTRLNMADPSAKNRRIFSLELPKEFAADLGKNSLCLVTLIDTKSEPADVRLLVVNPKGKVMQTLELRPVTIEGRKAA